MPHLQVLFEIDPVEWSEASGVIIERDGPSTGRRDFMGHSRKRMTPRSHGSVDYEVRKTRIAIQRNCRSSTWSSL